MVKIDRVLTKDVDHESGEYIQYLEQFAAASLDRFPAREWWDNEMYIHSNSLATVTAFVFLNNIELNL